MVSDRFEVYYERLITNTQQLKIKWRPIKDYIDDNVVPTCNESALAQHVQAIYCMEWFDLYLDKSFFTQKDNNILALLNYKAESASDGTVREILELVGCLKSQAPLKFFPEYLSGGFMRIQNAVLEYWNTKVADYNIGISDSFEILSAFTEED